MSEVSCFTILVVATISKFFMRFVKFRDSDWVLVSLSRCTLILAIEKLSVCGLSTLREQRGYNLWEIISQLH